jgi:hypothetical protein
MVRLEPDGASLGVEVHQLLLQRRDDRARFLTESKREPGGMTRALAFSQAGSFYGSEDAFESARPVLMMGREFRCPELRLLG